MCNYAIIKEWSLFENQVCGHIYRNTIEIYLFSVLADLISYFHILTFEEMGLLSSLLVWVDVQLSLNKTSSRLLWQPDFLETKFWLNLCEAARSTDGQVLV